MDWKQQFISACDAFQAATRSATRTEAPELTRAKLQNAIRDEPAVAEFYRWFKQAGELVGDVRHDDGIDASPDAPG